MTYEEAIEILKIKKECYDCEGLSCEMPYSKVVSGCSLCGEAIDMAIEALEKQQHKCENCTNMDRLGYCISFGIAVEPHMSCKYWSDEE